MTFCSGSEGRGILISASCLFVIPLIVEPWLSDLKILIFSIKKLIRKSGYTDFL